MDTQDLRPQLNTRDDPSFRFLGVPTLVRASAETTGGAFGLMEHWEMPAGFASPYHVHHSEDEAFYVLEGELAIVVDGEWMRAGPGTYAFGPREIPHGFKVHGSEPVRMLLLCSPGGFENFVLELSEPEPAPGAEPSPPDMEKLGAAAARFNIDLLGPLPEESGALSPVGAEAD